jgi:hypothetical protein
MTKVILNSYSGGIVNDPRNPSQDVARVVTNFDIVSKKNSLLPYRSSEDGNSNSTNDLMQSWCIAKNTSSPTTSGDFSLFGLGRQTASNKVRIFKKNLTTGASSDLDDNGWTETSNNTASAQSTPNYNLFVYYPKLGMIFGAHGSRYIYEYDPDGGTAFNETDADLTSFTNIGQGIVHSKDDILYIPYDNKIAKNDNGTWTTTALTLPSQYYITSICEFNDFIAIGAAPVDGVSTSRVFIWDRSTTLATVNESIDWGSGNLKVIEEIGGFLVGISLDGGASTTFKDRVIFRYFTGAGAVAFDYMEGSSSSVLLQAKQKINNRIYFAMSFSLNGSTRHGVWSYGRGGQGFNLVHERTPNNDTSISTGPMRGFFYVGNYLFQAFVDASSNHTVTKTDDSATYAHTSKLESQINPKMVLEDRPKLKQLNSIAIGYTSGASGQVIVKYRVDSSSSYTTVCTCTTTGVNVLEFKDASGVSFTSGREYEFSIESSLGAEIIYFDYDYSVIPTLA